MWGGGQGVGLSPSRPLPTPPASSSPSSLLERRARSARKIFPFFSPSLFSSPLPPPAPSSPSSLPLSSLLPPPLLPPPSPSSPPSRPLFSPSLLPCPPPHMWYIFFKWIYLVYLSLSIYLRFCSIYCDFLFLFLIPKPLKLLNQHVNVCGFCFVLLLNESFPLQET